MTSVMPIARTRWRNAGPYDLSRSRKQIARCSVPGKGFGHLAGKPVLRGILRDLEVNNPSAVEAEHNQGIQEPEHRGGNHEHVDRRSVRQVVAQEAPPGRGGDLGSNRSEPTMCVSGMPGAQSCKCSCEVTFSQPKHSFVIMVATPFWNNGAVAPLGDLQAR
jgi:hypothetical protein